MIAGRYILLSGILIWACWACKKVIHVDLNTAASQIVIQGNVTNDGENAQVKITRLVSFAADNTFPAVTGATVHITDSTTGRSYLLKEKDSGIYVNKVLLGMPQHVYRLDVMVDGQSYSAVSQMPTAVPLDSITFQGNIDLDGKRGINAVVYFHDPVGLGNYYQFMETVNGRALSDIFVLEDRLSDGRYIQDPLINDSNYLRLGDTLLLTMNCIDRNIYNYYYTLTNVISNNGIQAAESPANPNTNISNGALGYFSAHTSFQAVVSVY